MNYAKQNKSLLILDLNGVLGYMTKSYKRHGGAVGIYGKGENVRDWIYVEDNCAAVDFVRNNGKIGEIYNIPGYEEITNIQLTKKILEALGKDESLITFVEDRKGHDFRYAIDHSKLTQELGWKPTTSLEKGLRATVSWYLNRAN